MLDAVIFDWDGTLADTHSFIVKQFQEVLKEIGCTVSDKFLERKIGMGGRSMFEDALKAAEMPFDNETLDMLVAKKSRFQMEQADQIELLEGSIDLLKSLQGKVKINLATMAPRTVIKKILVDKEIIGYFDFIVAVEDVSRPKPDPEIFLYCAMKMGIKPERCVVLEDSIYGVEAAKKAKMKCIAITSGAYSKTELLKKRADIVFKSLKEKRGILDFIYSS